MARFGSSRLVIFDNDGTLVPSHLVANNAIQEGFVRFCERQGIVAPMPTDARLRDLTGLPGEEFYRALLPEEARGLAAELREFCLDHEVKAMLGQAEFYPGIRTLLQSLRARGAKLAVATNGGERYVGAVARRLGYQGLFDRVYFHGLDGLASKGEMALRALADLGPGPAVFVGDRRADFDAAREAGAAFIGCLYGYGTAAELSGADALVANPEDLAVLLLPPD
jgi:phosphoglycolate phosphatase-like HAD superfamily hydrolase